ncbi:uncharacterized protein [Branchiostoma lanceolatum]|uniref:uncharacterized protein n=1 Tax=Branchiostoma lanceolatum TaxID=7740 RepID=UPI003454E61F
MFELYLSKQGDAFPSTCSHRMAYLCKAKCKSIFQNSTEGWSVQNRPNNIDDFDLLTDKTAVANPGRFFREHGGDYYVFCADRQLGALVLVRPKEGTDLKESPFLREVLRRSATELLVLPLTDLAAVAAEVADDVSHIKTIFLHHTMRCGSTLLTRALEATGIVHGLSEPDILTSLGTFIPTSGPAGLSEEDREMLRDVIRCSNILLNFTLFKQDPSRTVVCHKPRGQAFSLVDLLQEAIPDAVNIFLYRGLAGYFDSTAYQMTGGSYWKYWLQSTLRLDTWAVQSRIDKSLLPYFDYVKFGSLSVPHGYLWFCVCTWLFFVKKVQDLTENCASPNAILRYEELIVLKEEMVLKVMENLGITYDHQSVKEKIRKVFGVNSQKGHAFQGRGPGGRTSWVGGWERSMMSAILDQTGRGIKEPDFLIKGTIIET